MVETGKFRNRKPSWGIIAMDQDEMLFGFCYHHPLKLPHWVSPVTACRPNPMVLSSSLACPVSTTCFMPETSSCLYLSFLSWHLCYHIRLITLSALVVPVSLPGSSCSNETEAHSGLFSYPSCVILCRVLLSSMCLSIISKESKINSKHLIQSRYCFWSPSVHFPRSVGCFSMEAPQPIVFNRSVSFRLMLPCAISKSGPWVLPIKLRFKIMFWAAPVIPRSLSHQC